MKPALTFFRVARTSSACQVTLIRRNDLFEFSEQSGTHLVQAVNRFFQLFAAERTEIKVGLFGVSAKFWVVHGRRKGFAQKLHTFLRRAGRENKRPADRANAIDTDLDQFARFLGLGQTDSQRNLWQIRVRFGQRLQHHDQISALNRLFP